MEARSAAPVGNGLATRNRRLLRAVVAGSFLLAGCSSSQADGPRIEGAGGGAPADAGAGLGGGAVAGAAAGVGSGGGDAVSSGGMNPAAGMPPVGGGGSGTTDGCPEVLPLRHAGGASLDLVFTPLLAGKPLVMGEPNPVPGGEVTPTNARFYVSEVELLRADGSVVLADSITSTGSAAPFGVQLVNLEDRATSTVRVQAPPGDYVSARFTFGINDACNAGGQSRPAPLSANSQMVWPHVAGFLFLRYEALWSPTGGSDAAPPSMIHMGGVVGKVFAPRAALAGPLTVPAAGAALVTVGISFDEIFRGTSGSGEVSGIPFPSPEVIAGEHLRRAVPELSIFTVMPP